MKTIWESLLDDDIIDQIDDKVDFYKRAIQYVKDSGSDFGPQIIYSAMVETTWANRDWKQYASYFCKLHHISHNEFMTSKQFAPIRGMLEFIQHMSHKGDWFRASTGSKEQVKNLSIKLNTMNKYIGDKQLQELSQIGLYMSGSDRHNPNIAINCDKWILCYDEWNMCFYLMYTTHQMSSNEKKVIETMMYQIEKNS